MEFFYPLYNYLSIVRNVSFKNRYRTKLTWIYTSDYSWRNPTSGRVFKSVLFERPTRFFMGTVRKHIFPFRAAFGQFGPYVQDLGRFDVRSHFCAMAVAIFTIQIYSTGNFHDYRTSRRSEVAASTIRIRIWENTFLYFGFISFGDVQI